MNFLVVIDHFNFESGPTTNIRNLIDFLSKSKQVKLTVLFGLDNSKPVVLDKNVRILPFQLEERGIFKKSSLFTFLRIVSSLLKEKKKRSFDIIISSLYMTALSVAFLKHIGIFKKEEKVFYNFTGARFLEAERHLLSGEKLSLFQIIKFRSIILLHCLVQKYICNFSDVILVKSEYAKQIVLNYFLKDEAKVQLIPGAINYPSSITENSSAPFPVLHKHSFILFLPTRLEKRKGIDIAIQSIKLLAPQIPNIVLFIMIPPKTFIDHSLLDNYLELIRQHNLTDKVLFIAGVKNSLMSKYYMKADLTLCCAVDLETFGFITVESMACGTPVIASNAGANPEIIQNISKNLLFRNNDSKDLALKIMEYYLLSASQKQLLKKKMKNEMKKYSFSSYLASLKRVRRTLV